MTRVCDILLNSPSSFINLLRIHSAQEERVVFLCHVFKTKIPLHLQVPAELPFSSILQKQNSWHQKSNLTWDHAFFHSPASNLEAWNKGKICFSPLSILFFSILFKQAGRFKLTCHLSSQEEQQLISSLSGALNNKICPSWHFFPSH